MAEEKEMDLRDKIRLQRRAHPHETDSQQSYRERLTGAVRRTHLGEGEKPPELSAAEKLRLAATTSKPPTKELPKVSAMETAYTAKMIAVAKKNYGVK